MDAVRHGPEATTVALAAVRRAWIPPVTSAAFVVLAAVAHASHPSLVSVYRDSIVAAAGVLVLAAAAALCAVSRAGGRRTRVDGRWWLALAVLTALWLSLVEAHALASGRRPTVAFITIGGALLVVFALLARGHGRARGQGTGLLTDADSAAGTGDLGSYRLLEPIGSGGMGEVWRATHQMLARQAAIKLVRPRSGSLSAAERERFVRRFHREANTIASLQSPNTIYLYDFGVTGDGQFYYAMELVDGISLDTLVKTFGPQPASRVRHILRQICESLEEAHQRNLVHRDLKPSNVMLCKLALAHDFIKVLDFGLAKCAACEDVQPITMDNIAAGTPGYIAPEVALAEEVIDGRADLYALGCVGYYLITGRLVFDDANPMTMVLKHVQTAPVPPSERTELPVPPDLERVIMKCLEKAPDARPQSARQVAAMLDACDIDDWSADQAAAWWQVHLPESSSLRIRMGGADGSDQAPASARSRADMLARS